MKLHLVNCSVLKMIEYKDVKKDSVLVKLASNLGWHCRPYNKSEELWNYSWLLIFRIKHRPGLAKDRSIGFIRLATKQNKKAGMDIHA